MNRTKRATTGMTLALALALSGSTPARAASPFVLPSDATLAQLITDSLKARHEITAAEAGVRAQRARVPQAGAMPDPTLQFGIQNDGFTSWEIGKMETSFYSVVATQTLPWPGKRDLRAEIAEIGVDQSRNAVERLKRTTEAEVRRGYIGLLLARSRLDLVDRLLLLWTKSTETARAVFEAGNGTQSDILRSQLEQTRLRQRRIALVAEERRLAQDLNRLRSHDFGDAIPTQTRLIDLGVPTAYDEDEATAFTLEHSPELNAARSAITAGERAVNLAQKSYFPDFTVSAGIMPRGGDLVPMWLLSIGGPIPIFAGSKQSRAVEESASRTVATRVEAEHIEHVLRLRVRERLTALAALLETIAIYRDGLLIQSQATTESALAQYRVGKVGFASVLEAVAGTLGDQDGYLQSLADAHQILIAAQELSLEPVGSTGGAAMATSSMPTSRAGAASTGGGTSAVPAGDGGSEADGARPMAGGM